MTQGKRAKCPISGIYCDDCGILQDEQLGYCPIVKFLEDLERMDDALEKLVEKEK
jgi:hypothetical protein